MKIWKRNAVVVAIVLFVGVAVYLNWSYNSKSAGDEKPDSNTDKTLGQTSLVSGDAADKMDGEEVASDGSGETSVGTGYFSTARLNRQQARDNALELLRQAAADEKADQTMVNKTNAVSITLRGNQILHLCLRHGIGRHNLNGSICIIDHGLIRLFIRSCLPQQLQGIIPGLLPIEPGC